MSAKKPKKLFLLDATALAYRSHFAFVHRPLVNSRGRNVGALYAYTGTLLRILRQEEPDLIAAAFDTPEPTFRHAKYEEYKATRDKTPDDLIEQLPDIKTITEGLGVPILEQPGWDADDLIGTLARRGEEAGFQVYIVAGDKDFMQLVSERVLIYNPMRPDSDVIIQDTDAVREKFGVEPDKVVEVLGLMGDSSDNVPGVPGVGVKTAVKLIQEYGSIESLYEGLDTIKSKALKGKLDEHRDKAFLSRELVVIDTEAPVGAGLDDLAPRDQDTGVLKEKFIELEFSSYISHIEAGVEAADDERHYTLVDSDTACDRLLERMKKARAFAFDTETTSLDPRDAAIVGVSIAIEEHEAFYIPALLPGQLFAPENSALKRFLKGFAELAADPGVTLIGQNLKYDLAILRQAGISDIKARLFDTMVAHYLCHPGDMQHGLDFLSLKYLGVKKRVRLRGRGHDAPAEEHPRGRARGDGAHRPLRGAGDAAPPGPGSHGARRRAPRREDPGHDVRGVRQAHREAH